MNLVNEYLAGVLDRRLGITPPPHASAQYLQGWAMQYELEQKLSGRMGHDH